MKKYLSFLLAVLLACTCGFTVGVTAEEEATPLEFYKIIELPDGLRIVYTQREAIAAPRMTVYVYDGCGVVDKDGNFIVEPIYQDIFPPVEGRARYLMNGEFGYFDESWSVDIPPVYSSAQDFSEGLAAVGDKNWCIGYIDKAGNPVIPFIYDDAQPFKDGVATVSVAEEGYYYNTFYRTGKIDREGNIVEPLAFRFEEESFDVLMSENMAEIDGVVYQNDTLTYPFLNYLGYSYIPLTWGTCRAMGILCFWTPETGLTLFGGEDQGVPEQGGNTMKSGVYGKATLYTGKITIEGQEYDASDFYYPLLFYRDIVYLPILYREGMERLRLNYSYRRDGDETTRGCMVFEHD